MPAPLEYDFRVVGLNTVKRAIRNVERDVVASTRRILRANGLSAASVRSSGRTGYTPRVASEARVRQRAEEMAARARIKAETQAERARIAGIKRAEREEEKSRQRLAKAQARARQKRIAERRKAAVAEERARTKAAAAAERTRAREAARADRNAMLTARARATTRAGLIGTAGRSAVGAVRGIGRYAVMSAGLMGGFAAGGAIRNAQRVETASVQLANQAYRPGGAQSRKEIADQVRSTAREVGAESGFGAEGIVSALRQFVAISGDLPAALRSARFMADIADASGADITDVGRTGGQIQQALRARGLGSEEAAKETEAIMAAVAGQAKVGSIEFRDLAQQMGKLVSATARFDGQASELVSTMGAVSQLAIAGAASSPEEAMTAILRFSDDIIQNARRFKAAGVDVYTDKTQTKLQKPEEILTQIVGSTKGNLSKIKKVFGIRAMKAVAPFQTIYSEAAAAAGGGDKGHAAGMKAMTDLLESVRGVKMTPAEIRGSARAARQTSEKQFAKAMEEFNQAVGTELMPVVTRLVPKFADLVPHLATAAKWLGRFVDELAKNPLQTIGRIIAAKVALDIAGAGIGAAVRAAIQSAMLRAQVGAVAAGGAAGTGGAVATGAAAGGARRGPAVLGLSRGAAGVMGGAVAAALTGVTLGVIVKEAIEVSMIKGWHEQEDKTDDLMRRTQRALASGNMQEVARLRTEWTGEKEKLEKRQSVMRVARTVATGGDTTLGKIAAAAVNPLGALFGAVTPMQELEQEGVGVHLRTAKSQLAKLEDAEVSTDAFMASMDAAKNSNEQFLTSINALAANFQKLGEAADSASASVGKPNTSNSPTIPQS